MGMSSIPRLYAAGLVPFKTAVDVWGARWERECRVSQLRRRSLVTKGAPYTVVMGCKGSEVQILSLRPVHLSFAVDDNRPLLHQHEGVALRVAKKGEPQLVVLGPMRELRLALESHLTVDEHSL